MSRIKHFAVIENAGYLNEREVHQADTAQAAWRWFKRQYSKDEEETLHPDVCCVFEDGTREYGC